MSINVVYLSVIGISICIGFIRGGVKSIGGLIAMIISWVLARSVAGGITLWLFEKFGIETYLAGLIAPFQDGTIANNLLTGADVVKEYTNIPFVTGVTQTFANSLNVTAYNICTMLTTVLAFAVLLCISGLILKIINTGVNSIPMSKGLNAVLGGVCGLIKGVILCLVLYFIFICLNSLFGTHIPIDTGYLTNIWQNIQGLHF